MKSLYNKLNDKQFTKLKLKLIALENKVVIPFCNKNKISLDRERYYEISLAINLHKEDKDFKYSASLYYNEEKSLFSFGVIKYFDIEDKRYYKEKDLEKNKPLEYFNETILSEILKESLDLYNSWDRSDLNEFIERTPPPKY